MRSPKKDKAIAFSEHNHGQCKQSLLGTAKSLCAQRRVRLTPRRLQVFNILLGSHQPMGAYEVLQTMNEEEKNITPPIVYRALEFLQEQGLVHRLESQNAFIACMQPGHPGEAQFLICSKCQRVAELDDPFLSTSTLASQLGFEAQHAVVEINGLCASCRRQ
jgi:Fur family zinc uptake transcriptional regulator